MEGAMNDYSHLVVFFLLLPVLMQIIFPLLMLIAYTLVRAMKIVFGRQKEAAGVNDFEKAGQDMQLGRI